jgi:hypothetical protein
MTTRAELRQKIRDELNDNATAKLWTDALLNDFIVQAIRAYGRELPKQASATITAVADQEAYALPSDFDRAMRVEQPDGEPRVPGLGSHVSSEQASYRLWGNQLILDPAPDAAGSGQDVSLEYLARYAEPAADGDTLATPPSDDDVLVAFACADAMRWIGSDEAKRARFERQRGASPGGAAEAYERRAQAAILGRKRRLRSSALEVL